MSLFDWFKKPEPMQELVYAPEENITAWELAHIVQLPGHNQQAQIALWHKFPPGAKRHFSLKKSS